MSWASLLVATGLSGATVAAAQPVDPGPAYFQGRWAMLGEDCRAPTSWTMIPGGNFLSENLTGTWQWSEGKLLLRLDDLAIDEETGEAGGRFRLDGPVEIIGPDRFDFAIEPDLYQLQRCPDQ